MQSENGKRRSGLREVGTYNIRFYYKVLRVMEGKRFAVKGSRPIIMLKVGLGLFNGI